MKSGAAQHPIAAFPAEASHLEMVLVPPRLQNLDVLLQVSTSCLFMTCGAASIWLVLLLMQLLSCWCITTVTFNMPT